jgi:hypothetical protein
VKRYNSVDVSRRRCCWNWACGVRASAWLFWDGGLLLLQQPQQSLRLRRHEDYPPHVTRATNCPKTRPQRLIVDTCCPALPCPPFFLDTYWLVVTLVARVRRVFVPPPHFTSTIMIILEDRIHETRIYLNDHAMNNRLSDHTAPTAGSVRIVTLARVVEPT